ncbi:MAG: glutamyl-tRNA reductase [Gammaproteobacteria bacterium]|nr:glutamyl-tRNA reductase [Gammaproteobacteria bacterium]
MSFLAIGLNHKTAPVEIREKLSFPAETIQDALHHFISNTLVSEASILSTCNRTEIYCNINIDDNDDDSTHSIEKNVNSIVIDWIKNYLNLADDNIEQYLYIHQDKLAIVHMLRVASGLDSMVLGEPQILGQMKTAFHTAKDTGTIGQLLHKLFQHTFNCAKQVRTDTAIGESAVSVAFASVSLAKQVFSDFNRHTALLIGAGETIELVALHLKEVGIKQIIIANRTIEKAHTIASDVNGYAIGLDEIPDHLAEADIVISSTASPVTLVDKSIVEQAIAKRKQRPMLMVDIAVPRDIDERINEIDDVFLYTVDDLTDIINEGLKSRQEAAVKAEDIIETQAVHFMSWIKSLKSINTLCRFREQAEHIRDVAIEEAIKDLNNHQPAEEVIKKLATQLTNKIIHTPSIQIKQAGMDDREDIIKAACTIFKLN